MENIPERVKQPPLQIPIENNENISSNYGKCLYSCGEFCGFFRIWMPCCFCCIEYPYLEVDQGQEGLLMRFGKHLKVVQPGLQYRNPCTDQIELIDIRINVIDLERQQIMTKDNVTINIDASVYFYIKTARYAVYRITNYNQAVAEITYSILKNTVGMFQLQDLLVKRQEIADDIEKQVEKYVEDWGIHINHIYIKDIQLNDEIQKALSSAASEQRYAESKLIQTRADVESAKMMRQAAEYLDSKSAMQIRFLETIGMLGSHSSTKVCFVPEEGDENKLNHRITQALIH